MEFSIIWGMSNSIIGNKTFTFYILPNRGSGGGMENSIIYFLKIKASLRRKQTPVII